MVFRLRQADNTRCLTEKAINRCQILIGLTYREENVLKQLPFPQLVIKGIVHIPFLKQGVHRTLLVQQHPVFMPKIGGAITQLLISAANADIRLFLQSALQQVGKHIRIDPVIGIDPADPVPLGRRQTCVAGSRHTAVTLVDYTDPRILCPISITDGGAAICGAVVHQNDLQIFIYLRQNTVQTSLQILFYIIDWDDN